MTRQAPNVASTLARLRNLADAGGLSFNDMLQRYVIERFLDRISRLPDADTVLLKGAQMLRVWGLPRARPTMDIDMLRRGAADQAAPVEPTSRLGNWYVHLLRLGPRQYILATSERSLLSAELAREQVVDNFSVGFKSE